MSTSPSAGRPMTERRKSNWCAAVRHLLALGALAGSLQGQDVYSNTVSARSHAMGGVYIPSPSGVLDALAANPAGLSALSAPTLEFNLTGVFARGSFSNSANQNAPLDTSPGVVPAGTFGMRMGQSRFAVGAGLVPDLGSVANWTLRDAPGTAGATYGTQKYTSKILALRAVTGVSISLSPAVSLYLRF